MSEFDGIDFSAPVAPKQINRENEFDGIDFTSVSQPQQEEEQQGFIERTAPQLQERNERAFSDVKNMIKGDVPPLEAMLNVSGEIAGGSFDVLGEGLVSAGRGIAGVTPDFIKEPIVEGATEAFQTVVNSDIGKVGIEALRGGIESYREFKSENPRIARMLESTLNVGLILSPAKVKAKSNPSILTKASDKVKTVADTQFKNDRAKFLETLVGPVRDLRTLKREVPRTTEKGFGPFKRSVVAPTEREVAMAKEVGKIKGVTHKNSVQGNYNLVAARNRELAVNLEKDIANANIKIPQQRVLQQLDDVIDDAIENNMFIVGTGEGAGEKLRSNVAKIIIKHADSDGFIKGDKLLAARKELDKVIKEQKPTVFNENTAESSIEIIAKATRNSMNDILDASVTGSRKIDLKVKSELKRQSLLFSAMDNMTPKAAAEANTAIIRAVQNAMKVIPVRNEAVQLLAASAGIGGLGAAAMGAPIVRDMAILSGTIYGTYRGVKSVGLKRVISKSLEFVDDAIRTSENPSMIKALRADRALIVELLENTVGHGETNKPIPAEPEQ